MYLAKLKTNGEVEILAEGMNATTSKDFLTYPGVYQHDFG
jgi:hypothetical protein